MKLEKTDPHVWHIYAIHTKTADGLDHVVLVEKYGCSALQMTGIGADKLFNKRFSNEEAMERVHGSPLLVEMTKKINPLLEEPAEFKHGQVVLGFQDRQR
jgi:hypothetical protein